MNQVGGQVENNNLNIYRLDYDYDFLRCSLSVVDCGRGSAGHQLFTLS